MINANENFKISIHAPRVGSDCAGAAAGAAETISIHAPRVGSDPGAKIKISRFKEISIHAPRVGSD